MTQSATRDFDEVYRQWHRRQQLQVARTLITDELIEEHRRSPLGHQSDALARLAFILSNGGHAGKYAIHAVTPFAAYRVIALSGQRGTPPTVVDDTVYPTADAAYHAVFLRRIADALAESSAETAPSPETSSS